MEEIDAFVFSYIPFTSSTHHHYPLSRNGVVFGAVLETLGVYIYIRIYFFEK